MKLVIGLTLCLLFLANSAFARDHDDDENCAGCWTTHDPSEALEDPWVEDALEAALELVQNSSSGKFNASQYEVTKAISYKTQVVEGINIQLAVILTNLNDQTQKLFSFVLWYRPWLENPKDKYQLLQKSLTDYSAPKRQARAANTTCGGCWQDHDTKDALNDPVVEDCLDAALNIIGEDDTNKFDADAWNVSKVLTYKTQVVNGVNVQLVVVLEDKNHNLKLLSFVIWYRPYLNDPDEAFQLLDHTLADYNPKSLRQLRTASRLTAIRRKLRAINHATNSELVSVLAAYEDVQSHGSLDVVFYRFEGKNWEAWIVTPHGKDPKFLFKTEVPATNKVVMRKAVPLSRRSILVKKINAN